jgi:hypothetical protein
MELVSPYVAARFILHTHYWLECANYCYSCVYSGSEDIHGMEQLRFESVTAYRLDGDSYIETHTHRVLYLLPYEVISRSPGSQLPWMR